MSDLIPADPGLDAAYARIRSILAEARNRAYLAINAAMVAAYWEVGRTIVEVEQQGAERAGYGRQLVEDLARRLRADLGKGFDRSNLWHMRAFYLAYPILDAVRRELSWTHYRILSASITPTREAFTKRRPSRRDGPPGSLSVRSDRSSSSGWP
jgi:hypothetical protein